MQSIAFFNLKNQFDWIIRMITFIKFKEIFVSVYCWQFELKTINRNFFFSLYFIFNFDMYFSQSSNIDMHSWILGTVPNGRNVKLYFEGA